MSTGDETPWWQQIIGCLLFPVIVPVAIVVIPILNVLGLNKSRAGPEYLIEQLEGFIEGSQGPWDLDDFCSVPLADPELESIRLQACDHLPMVTGDVATDEDREALERLVRAARALQRARE